MHVWNNKQKFWLKNVDNLVECKYRTNLTDNAKVIKSLRRFNKTQKKEGKGYEEKDCMFTSDFDMLDNVGRVWRKSKNRI